MRRPETVSLNQVFEGCDNGMIICGFQQHKNDGTCSKIKLSCAFSEAFGLRSVHVCLLKHILAYRTIL